MLVLSVLPFVRVISLNRRTGYFCLADWQDHLQEVTLQLLWRLPGYDPSRSSIATWFRPRILRTTQAVWGATTTGYAQPPDSPHELTQLVNTLGGVGGAWPRTDEDWRDLAFAATGRRMTRETVQAYVRLTDPVGYLAGMPEDTVDAAVPIGADPSSISDVELVEILGRQTVRAAIATLTPGQRERIAELVGIAGRNPETQTAIAARLGVTRQAVSLSVRLGGRTIRQTGALAHLDEDTVVHREQPHEQVDRGS